MSAFLSPVPFLQFFDDAGKPLSFGTLSTFIAGTNTPIATFVDASGLVENEVIIELDIYGMADVWLSTTVAYKYVVKDKLGNIIKTTDNITVGGGDSGTIDWASITNKPSTFTPSPHNQSWATITARPTTLGGYGITDAYTKTEVDAKDTIIQGQVTTNTNDLINLTSSVNSISAAVENNTLDIVDLLAKDINLQNQININTSAINTLETNDEALFTIMGSISADFYSKLDVSAIQNTSAVSNTEQVYSTLAINTFLSSLGAPVDIESSTGITNWTTPCLSAISTTTFNIGSFSGTIVDSTALVPTSTPVYCSGATNVTPAYLTTQNNTYVMVTSAGVLSYQSTYPTGPERRTKIFLGGIAHPNRTTIQNVIISPDVRNSALAQLRDYLKPIKLINDGIIAYPNGANLSLNTTGGVMTGLGINYANDINNPSVLTIGGVVSATFQYKTQVTSASFANTTLVVPGSYDNGGVVTAYGGPNGQATNQYIFKAPSGALRIQYGQQIYSSVANAVAGISNEQFIFNQALTDNLIPIGILTVRKAATNLSLTTDAVFTKASKFGEIGIGGTGGTSTTTLNAAYLNSPTPEITTTNGVVTMQNGIVGDTNDVFEVANYAGVVTMKVDGNGLTSATSFVEGGTTLSSKYQAINTTLTKTSADTLYSTIAQMTAVSGVNTTQTSNIATISASDLTKLTKTSADTLYSPISLVTTVSTLTTDVNNKMYTSAATASFVNVSGDTMTGKLTLAPGTTANAPLQFQTGTLLSTPVAGTIEWDGSSFWLTLP